ncbi:Cyclin-like F-box [Cordyceps militaris]|uniref:Cyclin-like F-box n=1 Tax=Cordyceps militaris TaxID=73501 RepID=A0A2H4SNP1_CORMI|nr:Cyclin-like F-box [Cordyceps militaris]
MTEHSGNRHANCTSLDALPDDIIEQVLLYVSPLDNLAGLQSQSRRLHGLASQPLLWKYHCLAAFQYWQPEHGLERLLLQNASATNWKALFLKRQSQNSSIARLLDRIVTSRVNRIEGMQQICEYGYDAKDFLIEKCRTTKSDPRVLAVRHYAGAVLGSIHRNLAIQQWFQLSNSEPTDPLNTRPSLEKSLAAFDLFVLHDERGDLNETSQLLDNYTNLFMTSQTKWSEKSTREQALALNHWIRAANLVGLDDQEQDYRNLRNCFIGQALRDSNHESVPIISCAIYCCIAERIGLQAECFLAPICVHIVVTAPPGYDLDMKPSQEEHQMYLDPFATNGEVPLNKMEHLVSHADMTIASLRNSGTVFAITTRTARNIEASHAAGARRADPLSLSRLLGGHAALNRQLALYATRWALLILQVPFTQRWRERRTQLLQRLLRDWPEDEWIMSQYVLAQSRQGRRGGGSAGDAAVDHAAALHRAWHPDRLRAEIFQNALTPARVAPYRIGQIFVHRRYQWLGAIVGFYEVPTATWGVIGSTAIASEGGSAAQSSDDRRWFYIKTIAASSTDEQVIAPKNLEIMNDASQVTDGMFPLAGKFFKRFDRQKCRFVSNVDEEYPRLAGGD